MKKLISIIVISVLFINTLKSQESILNNNLDFKKINEYQSEYLFSDIKSIDDYISNLNKIHSNNIDKILHYVQDLTMINKYNLYYDFEIELNKMGNVNINNFDSIPHFEVKMKVCLDANKLVFIENNEPINYYLDDEVEDFGTHEFTYFIKSTKYSLKKSIKKSKIILYGYESGYYLNKMKIEIDTKNKRIIVYRK